ncbi:MAG: response regulator [Candidatus Omnitrophota bacterium]|nr:response regulator [Candidatus Omnitrophota bacterium]
MNKKKVLLVDDEVDFLTLMHKIVSSWGYDVLTTSCGDEAIEFLKRERVDTIIIDYSMPDIDGIELLKKIRAKSYRVPAIMFTAKPPSIKTMEATKGLHIVAFIPKINPSEDTLEDLKVTLDLACRGT